MAYNRKVAEELISQVLDKLDKSADQYKDAYILNDVAREVDEEIIDIVGWPLLQAIRVREAMQQRVYQVDQIYWPRFTKHQTTEFLQELACRVLYELKDRNVTIEDLKKYMKEKYGLNLS